MAFAGSKLYGLWGITGLWDITALPTREPAKPMGCHRLWVIKGPTSLGAYGRTLRRSTRLFQAYFTAKLPRAEWKLDSLIQSVAQAV
ncbi:hypothetical protein NUW54_g14239 [Trametes sanguinea]|uniref:Uncharacterized protein n=1 Tax=Trametes sanguinea TaxID=158606 RepID=A0ACC1MFQ6_9APHY|nr:hypothetical protein NUW54_g14239 [Trametes sanguinea]